MWLRFRYPNSISDSEQVKKALGLNGVRSYLFWKKDGAVCDVRNKEDAYFLLNPGSDRVSEYEIAHEKYGFFFDQNGNQIEMTPTTSTNGSPHEKVSITAPVVQAEAAKEKPSFFKRKPGRPRKNG